MLDLGFVAACVIAGALLDGPLRWAHAVAAALIASLFAGLFFPYNFAAMAGIYFLIGCVAVFAGFWGRASAYG
ncbi:MAG: hypothetical protein QOD40_1788 [Alphaproteobacteria bacterium]|jgi:hypothetical protein|nr:hypothetical protein [Alphaproteobacteria bacterium]